MHKVRPHASTALPTPLLLPIPSRRTHEVHCGNYTKAVASPEATVVSLWAVENGHTKPQYPKGFRCSTGAKSTFLSEFDTLYSLGDVVGAGSQSFVYACQLRLRGHVEVGHHHLDEKTLCVKHMLEEKASIEALKFVMKLDHPNVVRHYCVYRDVRGLWVVMDYLQGPELLTRLLQNGGRFSEETCKSLCRQIMSAIECVHTQGLVHCDIKLENFVVIDQAVGDDPAESDDEQISIALVDFGSAELAGTRRRIDFRDASSGTLMYLAPERFFDAPADAKGDMWAAGIMLCILLTGKPFFGELEFLNCMKQYLDFPLERTNGAQEGGVWDKCGRSLWTMKDNPLTSDVLAAIENRVEETFRQPEWLAVSLAAKRLVRRLLRSEPSKRLSATDALRDPWLVDQVGTLI